MPIKVLKASAGSGKTYTLANEYLDLLEKSLHSQILAVTFTNKATEEMKQRILEELYNLSVKGRKSEHLDDIKKSTLLDEDKIFGCGLTYGYQSIVGPLEASMYWSDRTDKVGFLVNFGYNF